MSKSEKGPPEPVLYCRIGHADPEDRIWIWMNSTDEEDHGKLLCAKAENNTHERLYGKFSEECWRGRYEESTGRLSILAPKSAVGPTWQRLPPPALLDQLEKCYASDDIYYFMSAKER